MNDSEVREIYLQKMADHISRETKKAQEEGLEQCFHCCSATAEEDLLEVYDDLGDEWVKVCPDCYDNYSRA